MKQVIHPASLDLPDFPKKKEKKEKKGKKEKKEKKEKNIPRKIPSVFNS